MNKLQVSKAAQKDLQEIKAYLAVDLENPGVAVAAVSKITKKIRLWKDNPLMGPALTAVTDANSDERFLVCGNYLVFYSVTRENIFIDRVLYGRRDYLRVLFGEQADTVLFDKEEDMEMEKDTSMHSVQVDWIFLTEKKIKRYYFERKKDSWFLEAINVEKMAEEHDGKEDFYTFYERFSRDSLFQQERLHEPLYFVTADPEDEFQILETTLEPGQWFAFRPPMIKGKMTNVHYGQPENIHSDYKVVEFKGFGNGFSNTLYFERRENIWQLIRFEDLSD